MYNSVKFKFLIFIIFIFLISCSNKKNSHISASGTIEATNTNIGAKNTGEILKIFFEEGNLVKKGDTLAIIDHSLLDMQLNELNHAVNFAKAQYDLVLNGARKEDIDIAESNLKQSKINLELAEKDFNRINELYKTESISQKQKDDAETRYLLAKAQYDIASSNLKKLKSGARNEEIKSLKEKYEQTLASFKLLQKKINDCFIISPIDGYITNKLVEIGEIVNYGSPIATISNLDTVYLTIYISELELSKIKLGQKANIFIDSQPDNKIEGEIIYISPIAEFTPKNIQTKEDRIKQMFAVKLKISNNNHILKEGMPADAIIIQ